MSRPFTTAGTVTGVAFSGARLGALLTGADRARLVVYDPTDGQIEAAHDLPFAADGLRSLGAGWLVWGDGTLACLTEDGELGWRLAEPVFRAVGAAGLVASVSRSVVTLRSAGDGAEAWAVDLAPDQPFEAAISADGGRVAVGTQKGRLLLLDAATGAELVARKRTKILALAFTPDGSGLVVGHGNGTVRLVDGRSLAAVRGFASATHHFEPSGPAGVRWAWTDGTEALTLGNEGLVRSWSVPAGAPGDVLEVPGHHAQGAMLAVSGDGRFVVVGNSPRQLTRFDRQTGDVQPPEVPSLLLPEIHSGSWRAEPGVEHVDLFDGTTLAARIPCSGGPQGCAFGPDGAWLAVVGRDVTVWSVGPAPVELARVALDWGDVVVRGVAISGNGRLVISADTWDNHFTAESALLFVDVGTGTVETLPAPDAHRLGGVGWIGGDRFAVVDAIGRLHVAESTGWVELRPTSPDPVVPRIQAVLPLVARPGHASHLGLDGEVHHHVFDVTPETFALPAFTPAPQAEASGVLDERLAGATFLFTGKFRRTSKEMREKTVVELGAKVSKNLKNATHVVVGVDPYDHKPSTAEVQARAAIDGGAPIELLDEEAFLALALPTPEEVTLLLAAQEGGKERYQAWMARARAKAHDVALCLGPISLAGADLSEIDFRYCDLAGANLRGADLTRADFERANLRGADLRGCQMERTGVYHAQLHGADLRDAHIPQQLYVVAYDGSTRWPEGVTLPRQP